MAYNSGQLQDILSKALTIIFILGENKGTHYASVLEVAVPIKIKQHC
jgi:hypothetical protein